jgi:hypothetical protein
MWHEQANTTTSNMLVAVGPAWRRGHLPHRADTPGLLADARQAAPPGREDAT